MTAPDFLLSEGQIGSEEARYRVQVPASLRFFEGHFPGDPVVPGVAQLTLVERAVRRGFPSLGRPVEVKRVKFMARIGPGADLVLTLTRAGNRVRFRLAAEGVPVSQGTFVFRADPG